MKFGRSATGELVLTYTIHNGLEKKGKFKIDVREIDLWNLGIHSIRLDSLRQCLDLEVLSLRRNQVEAINLSPLSSTSKLRQLLLDSNKLTELDLTPLASCRYLEEIDLSFNLITDLDLTPLVNCMHLKSLLIMDCPIPKLDLTPLLECRNLRLVEIPRTTKILLSTGKDEFRGIPEGIENLLTIGRILESDKLPLTKSGKFQEREDTPKYWELSDGIKELKAIMLENHSFTSGQLDNIASQVSELSISVVETLGLLKVNEEDRLKMMNLLKSLNIATREDHELFKRTLLLLKSKAAVLSSKQSNLSDLYTEISKGIIQIAQKCGLDKTRQGGIISRLKRELPVELISASVFEVFIHVLKLVF